MIPEGYKRVSATVSDKTYQQLDYWSSKKGISINEFLNEAIARAIAWENKDYPIPTMEQARLNQLIDVVHILASNQKSLEQVVTEGFDSLLGLVRGDNYLLENDDGEI